MKRVSQVLMGGALGLTVGAAAAASAPPAGAAPPPAGGPVNAVLQEVHAALQQADAALSAASKPQTPPRVALRTMYDAEAALLYANGALMEMASGTGGPVGPGSAASAGANGASVPSASNPVPSQQPPQTGQAGGGAGATSPRAANGAAGNTAAQGGGAAPAVASGSASAGGQGGASTAGAKPGFKPQDTAAGGQLGPGQAEMPGTADDQGTTPPPVVSGTQEYHTPSQEFPEPAVSVDESGNAGERSGAAALESDSGAQGGTLAPEEAEQPGVQDNPDTGVDGGQMVARAEPPGGAPQLTLEEANKLIGKPVVNPQGKDLGQVVRIDAGPGDQVSRVVIQYGGVLGFFESKAAVSTDRVVAVRDNRLVVNLRPDELDKLPRAEH